MRHERTPYWVCRRTAVRPSVIALGIIGCAGCVLYRGQYKFAVFHRYGSTRISICVQVMLAAVHFVDDFESGRLFLYVIHRIATLLRRSVRVVLLGILLNLVAGVATCTRTSDRCQGLAAAATNLMSQDAADQRTESGTYQPVLIFDGLRVRDLFVVAFLPWNLDRSSLRLDAENLGGMGRLIDAITSDRTTGGHYDGSGNRASQKGYLHRQFLVTDLHLSAAIKACVAVLLSR